MPFTFTYESVQEWVRRHSEDGEPVRVNGLIHFPTGAVCHPSDWNLRQEPPTDPIELLRRRKRYFIAAIERNQETFAQKKRELLNLIETAKRYPNDTQIPDEYVQEVSDLKARHEQMTENLRVVSESLDKALGNDPNSESNRALRREQERKYRQTIDLQQRVEQINL